MEKVISRQKAVEKVDPFFCDDEDDESMDVD